MDSRKVSSGRVRTSSPRPARLGLGRRMVPVSIRSTAFSKPSVTLFGGASYELMPPLIDSLLCDPPAAELDPLVRPHLQHHTPSRRWPPRRWRGRGLAWRGRS